MGCQPRCDVTYIRTVVVVVVGIEYYYVDDHQTHLQKEVWSGHKTTQNSALSPKGTGPRGSALFWQETECTC